MEKFLRIDPIISGSNPLSASTFNFSFQLEGGELPALCNSRRRNPEVWSHREKDLDDAG